MVNILRLPVAYLNATINVKPETQNRRLEATGLAKPSETRGLTGTSPGLARQESAGQVLGLVWNRTDTFLRSKPGPLAGYPDPLLTLDSVGTTCPIGLGRPRIGVILSRIMTCTCHTGESTLTHTRNSRKYQFLIMICPISSSTPPSPKNTKLSHPSLSLHAMIKSEHQVQHTPSTAYTKYSIHRALHHPNIHCFSLPASLSSFGRPCCTQFSTFLQLRINQWLESQLPLCLPSELLPPDWPPPSTPPIWLNHGLQAHLQTLSITASKCITELAPSQPVSASPNSVDHDLQVHLQTHLNTASKCCSKLAPLQPPGVSRHLHDYRLQVCPITTSKCITKIAWLRPRVASLCSLDHNVSKPWS